jgi:catechol 2,3-dioxygenase-like lactoylglutathione lyase family enzyme
MTIPVMCGLRHLALRVTDVPRARAFYENVFGMRVVWQPDSEHVYLSSGTDNLALHQKPVSDPREETDSRARAMDHFGFIVDSPQAVDRFFEWIERNSVTVIHRPKRHRDGSYSFYLADPDGNVVQVLYEPKISRLRWSNSA